MIFDEESTLCPLIEGFRGGNRVELLRDGAQCFPSMLEEIGRARRLIFLEMYTFANDRTGSMFARALMERSRSGVQVVVVYDADGSRDTPRAFFSEMKSSGIQVYEFNPVHRLFYGLRFRHRNHGKLLLLDGEVAFVGGLNITREYTSLEAGGLGWRDTEVKVQGPLVSDLRRVAQAVLSHASRGHQDLPLVPPSHLKDAGKTRSLAVSAMGLRQKWKMGRHYQTAIRHSRRSVWIANPYFLPNAVFRRELRLAARRGVDVRVLVPSHTDFPPVGFAIQHLYRRMLRWGIRIFEWPGPMMHAKTGVIDGLWSTVGSYNLDRVSLLNNYEISLLILGREFGEQMKAMFEDDVARSVEVQSDPWSRRGMRRKTIERISYAARFLY